MKKSLALVVALCMCLAGCDQLREKLATVAWDKASIAAAIKEVLTATGLKMPQLAMPVRVLVVGTPQTPSLDAVLELLEREKVLGRLAKA